MSAPVPVLVIASRETIPAVHLLQLYAAGRKRLMHLLWTQDTTAHAGARQLLRCKLAVIIAVSRRWWMLPLGTMLRLCGVSVCWFLVGQARPEEFPGPTLPTDGRGLYAEPGLRELGDEEARWVSAVQALCLVVENLRDRRPTWSVARYCTAASVLLASVLAFCLDADSHDSHDKSFPRGETNTIKVRFDGPTPGPATLSRPGPGIPPAADCQSLGRLTGAPKERSGELWFCPDPPPPAQPKIPHSRPDTSMMP